MAQQADKSGSNDRLQVKCESGFKQKVRVEAAKSGKSMSAFVRDTLRDAFDGGTSMDKRPNGKKENTQTGAGSSPSDNAPLTDTSEGVYKESESDGNAESGTSRDTEIDA